MVKRKSIQILLVKRWRERIPASIKAKLPAHAVAMDDEPTTTKEHFLTQNTCPNKWGRSKEKLNIRLSGLQMLQ